MTPRWFMTLLGVVALLQYTDALEEVEESLTRLEDGNYPYAHSRVKRRSSSSSCTDILQYCAQWPEKYCWDYKEYMKTNCPRKCGHCAGPTTPPACRDKSLYCRGWKGLGFCGRSSRWFKYMKNTCPKTCGHCGRGGGGGGSCTTGASRKVSGCTFDKNTCDWYQVPYDDDQNFELMSGSAAHGGRGGYISARRTGKAQIVLPLELVLPHKANYGSMCLRFHFNGQRGNIVVWEISNTRGSRRTPVQRIRVSGARWTCVRVPVNVGIRNQLMIEVNVENNSPVNLDEVSFADRC